MKNIKVSLNFLYIMWFVFKQTLISIFSPTKASYVFLLWVKTEYENIPSEVKELLK